MFDIIVIGGTNIDIKAKAEAKHIAATSNPGDVSFTSGGVARNIAHNLGLLGVKVALISVIGNDAPGQIALSATSGAGVDLGMCLRTDATTGTYVAVLDEKGELVTAVNDMRILEHLTPEFVGQHSTSLQSTKFIVADCNVRPDLLEWLATHYAGKIIVEPVSVAKSEKLSVLLRTHEIFLATPNRAQLKSLADRVEVGSACEALHARGLQNLVVHLGSDGVLVSSANARKQIPSVGQSQVSDVTGAGDAAVAGLVYGLSKGHDLIEAAGFGQAAASLVLNSISSTAAGLSEQALQDIIKAGHE